MRYKEAYSYLNSFTNYEKVPGIKGDLNEDGLARVRDLISRLGNPHEAFRGIVVAGTKGKGSVAAMLDSVLREAGYRVGLYTSPHLHTFRERIRVDGEMIPPEDVARLVEKIRPVAEELKATADGSQVPTFYELATAIAFLYFEERGVNLAVLEVGLGGRLDAVNVVTPLVSVITSISMDHMEVLGDSIEEITYEKAGIIKPGGKVVTAPQVDEAKAVIQQVADHMGATVRMIGREVYLSSGNLPEVRVDEEGVPVSQAFTVAYQESDYGPETKLRIKLELMGNHQQLNAAVAIAALLELRSADVLASAEAVLAGMAQVRWPGRLEIIRGNPVVVLDGAHNADSVAKLSSAMHDLFYNQGLIVVFGSLANKDIEGMLGELGANPVNPFGPQVKKLIITRPNSVRAADPANTAELAKARGFDTEVVEEFPQAIQRAEALAAETEASSTSGPVILVTGSLYVVAEAREHYGLAPAITGEE